EIGVGRNTDTYRAGMSFEVPVAAAAGIAANIHVAGRSVSFYVVIGAPNLEGTTGGSGIHAATGSIDPDISGNAVRDNVALDIQYGEAPGDAGSVQVVANVLRINGTANRRQPCIARDVHSAHGTRYCFGHERPAHIANGFRTGNANGIDSGIAGDLDGIRDGN